MWYIIEIFHGEPRQSPGYSSKEEAIRIFTTILYPRAVTLGSSSIVFRPLEK